MKWGQLVLPVISAAIAVGVTKGCSPKPIIPVPSIITVHDTVRDTVRLAGPKRVTTDTIQLVVRETIHDTVQINVGSDTGGRSHVWPILNAEIGKSRGDTSRTTTFSLRSGKTTVATIWTPGPLRSIWADSTGVPRLDFYDPPAPPTVSLWTKLKWGGIGFGACTITNSVRR